MKKVLTLLTIFGCGLACISSSYSKTAFNNYNQKETAGLKYAAPEIEDIGTKIDSGIFSFKIEQRTKTPTANTFRFSVTLNDFSRNYTFGVYETADLPAIVDVDLVANKEYAESKGLDTGYTKHVQVPVDRGGTSGNYEALGPAYGIESITLYCTIESEYGLDIDFDTLNVTNIYEATYDVSTKEFIVDYDNKYYLNYKENAVNYSGAKKLPDVSSMEDSINYFGTKFIAVSQNLDTYSIRAQIECHAEEFYASKKPKQYNEWKDTIANGTNFIKVRLVWNANSEYCLTVKDANGNLITHNIPTFGSYINVEQDGITEVNVFLNEKYIQGEIVDFKILNFTYYISIWTSDKFNQVKTGVNYSEYFGNLTFRALDIEDFAGNVIYEKVPTNSYFNIELLLLLTLAGIVFVYATVVIAAYFYLKKKNKDDEFKKMNTPSYVKNAIHGFIFVTAFLMLVEFCVMRWGIFNNSVVVENNLDTWIIFLGIISIIWFGYWVKYFITQIKNNIEKRRVERLKLNVNSSDDGTK